MWLIIHWLGRHPKPSVWWLIVITHCAGKGLRLANVLELFQPHSRGIVIKFDKPKMPENAFPSSFETSYWLHISVLPSGDWEKQKPTSSHSFSKKALLASLGRKETCKMSPFANMCWPADRHVCTCAGSYKKEFTGHTDFRLAPTHSDRPTSVLLSNQSQNNRRWKIQKQTQERTWKTNGAFENVTAFVLHHKARNKFCTAALICVSDLSSWMLLGEKKT